MGSSFHLQRAVPRRRRVVGLASAAALLVGTGTGLAGGAAALASTQTYTVTKLGGLGGGTVGTAINATGEVVGASFVTKPVKVSPCPTGGEVCEVNPEHAVSWIGGKITDLGVLPVPKKGQGLSEAPEAEARAVNLSGEVVGLSNGNGFLFRNGQITQAGPAGFRTNGINDAGNIVGYLNGHAFLDGGGTMTQLPDLAGPGAPCCSVTVGINNNNEIAGNSDTSSSGGTHAVVWTNGTLTDLGTLGGPQSFAAAINNLGQVVGFAQTSTDTNHGFLYTGGKLTDLGPDFSPAAINDNTVIVGTSSAGAAVWSNGVLQNLNNLIPPGSGIVLKQATAINNNGQIVAEGNDGNGVTVFLLTPS
jgi:probable HAF family extracellular repeat protein